MRRIRLPRSRPRPGSPRAAGGVARFRWLGALGLVLLLAATGDAWAAAGEAVTAGPPWWVWSIGLFVACCLLGIVAVPAGIGGGTLFVPIVGSCFPFHLDYVRGAGLLVILDHGDGYLSLYGHNQSLLAEPGEVVKAGDVIATVGSSGGQQSPALYFAIRQQGRAINPAHWCRAQG